MDVAGFQLSRLPEGFYDNPYPVYKALQQQDPLHRLADGALFLTRYEDVVHCYKSPACSSDKKVEFLPKFGPSPLFDHHTTSLVFNDPPLHTRVRRLIMGAVSQRAVSRMEPALHALVDDLLVQLADKVADKGQVDLVTEFAAAIPIEVIGNLLAIPRDERGPLRDWSLAILSALEPVLSDEAKAWGNRSVEAFALYLRGLIAHRRVHPLDPREDVLTRLIEGEQGEGDAYRLTEFELIHQCIFLLNAGHETTTNLIGNGVWLLMRHPQAMQALRDDPALIPSAIEEMLRFEGPIQLNNRRLLEPLEIGGQRFDAGTLITLCLGAANRDPAEFDAPDTFDVTRRRNRHLTFGHAHHACVGMNVARLEGRIAIGRLLERFAHIDSAGEPLRDRRVRFRGFTTLPVQLA